MNYLKYFTLVFLLFFIPNTSQAEKLKWQVLDKDSKETPSKTVESDQSSVSTIATEDAGPTTNLSSSNNCAFSLTRFFTGRDYGKYDPIKVVIDGDIERVKSLAARGADFNVQDGFIAASFMSSSPIRKPYWTPLMYAAYNLKMVELLIELGADINFQNRNGTTAFMLIAGLHSLGAVKTLLDDPKFGVDTHLRDNSGNTAFLHAVNGGRLDIATFLLERHLVEAIDNRPLKEEIIQDAQRALRIATRNSSIDIVKHLLMMVPEMDINARGEDGWTAMMIARLFARRFVEKGRTEIADLLSQHGAEFSQGDHQTVVNIDIDRHKMAKEIPSL